MQRFCIEVSIWFGMVVSLLDPTLDFLTKRFMVNTADHIISYILVFLASKIRLLQTIVATIEGIYSHMQKSALLILFYFLQVLDWSKDCDSFILQLPVEVTFVWMTIIIHVRYSTDWVYASTSTTWLNHVRLTHLHTSGANGMHQVSEASVSRNR